MTVVEVRSRIFRIGMNFVAEVMQRCDRPLRGRGRAIEENGGSLPETMPMHRGVVDFHVVVHPGPDRPPWLKVDGRIWDRTIDESRRSRLTRNRYVLVR